MKKKEIAAVVLSFSLIIGILPSSGVSKASAAENESFKYTQDFSGGVSQWDSKVGNWITSYKKNGAVLNNWERYQNEDSNGMLKLSSGSRPVFWFSSPVTDGNIHLSYDICYTQSTKQYAYFFGGFQSINAAQTETGMEIDGNIDNKGLLNGFGVNTYSNALTYGFTSDGGGQSTKACEAGKWYKLDVIHENLGGTLVSRYYVDGELIYTRSDQSFTGSLYGVALYAHANNQDNAIYIDNFTVEHYYDTEKSAKATKYTQDFSGDVSQWDSKVGNWITSYKKNGAVLNNWERYQDENSNGMLKLSSGSRPVFWFSSPVTDGNIHLSYDICYTQSTKQYAYFFGGFQSINAAQTVNGMEIDGDIDNKGLLNGFGVNTYSNALTYGFTSDGGGQSTKACEAGKWYKLDVIHENLGGTLVSRYYVDGELIYTRSDQSFTGSLYGVALYAHANNQNNAIYIDNFTVEHYYDTEKSAKATLGATTEKTNVNYIALGTNEAPVAVNYGGKDCWLMDPENTDINIIFSPDFKPNSNDGSFYTVEVDYYDIKTLDGNDVVPGYFRLYYDAFDNSKKTGGTVYTEGTEEWKTAVFSLEDADFQKLLDNKYDLKISLKALTTDGMIASASNVAVSEIRIKRNVAKNPVFVSSSTQHVGHAFEWFAESKVITNTITNFFDEEQDVDITSTLLDENGREVFTASESLSIPACGVITKDVNIGSVERCGIYDWVVEVESSDGLESRFSPIKIAIIKTDPDGILNDDVYFAMHPSNETMEKGVEMLKYGNVGGVRSSVYWRYLEPETKGVYSWENHITKPFYDEVYANGMEILPLLYGCSDLYGLGITDMPYTYDELEGWKGYIREIASILSNDYGVKRFEIWNEPDIRHFNPRFFDDDPDNGGTGADYANLFKETSRIIKEINKDAKIGGPSIARVPYGSPFSGHEYFEAALNNGFADYADAITLHPYGYLGAPVDTNKSMINGINRFINSFKQKNSEITPEIWFTETGYTTADSSIGNAYQQGALNCRTAIFAKANGLSDLTVFYNLEKKGTIETNREDMFGHVSCGKVGEEKYGTYFVPEKSYLMIAAMNYVMAKTRAKSIHDSEDGTIRISRFSSEKFGKDVLAFYSTTGDAGIELDLGVNEITYLDCLGNATVKTSDNGIYTFAAEIAPQYIIGDFTKTECLKNDEEFVVKDVDLTVPGKAAVTVFAREGTQNPIVIITAAIKDGYMQHVALDEKALDAGLNTYTLDMDCCTDTDEVTVFLWNSKSDIIPICQKLTKKLGGK